MILSKYFIKEVKLPGETSIQKQEENEKSVLRSTDYPNALLSCRLRR